MENREYFHHYHEQSEIEKKEQEERMYEMEEVKASKGDQEVLIWLRKTGQRVIGLKRKSDSHFRIMYREIEPLSDFQIDKHQTVYHPSFLDLELWEDQDRERLIRQLNLDKKVIIKGSSSITMWDSLKDWSNVHGYANFQSGGTDNYLSATKERWPDDILEWLESESVEWNNEFHQLILQRIEILKPRIQNAKQTEPKYLNEAREYEELKLTLGTEKIDDKNIILRIGGKKWILTAENEKLVLKGKTEFIPPARDSQWSGAMTDFTPTSFGGLKIEDFNGFVWVLPNQSVGINELENEIRFNIQRWISDIWSPWRRKNIISGELNDLEEELRILEKRLKKVASTD